MAKKKPIARIIELNVRERRFLRALLVEYALRLPRTIEGIDPDSVNVSMELQQCGYMADRLLGKLAEPLDGFVGEVQVVMSRWRQEK